MVYPDKKCVEISIPKTATVSRYAMISDDFNHDDPDLRDDVARKSNCGRLLDDNQWPLTPAAKYIYSIHGHFTLKQWKEQDIFTTENYFSFSFVRNPYDRFISIMHNSTMDSCPCWSRGRSINTVQGFFELDNCCIHQLTRRYGTQFEFLEDENGEVGVDFVGKLENYEEDYNKLRELAPLLPPFDGRYRLNGTKQRQSVPVDQHYNHKTRDLVYEFYKDDFIKLGYEK